MEGTAIAQSVLYELTFNRSPWPDNDIKMMGENSPPDPPQDQLISSTELVFTNDMLLDKILTFAIYDGNRLLRKSVNNCKLVKRLWLETIITVVQKSERRSPIELNVLEAPSKFKKFLVTFKDLPRKRIPPFSLKIAPSRDDAVQNANILSKEQQKECIECITRCGVSLVNLNIVCFPTMWNLLESPSLCHISTEPVRLPHLEEISITEYICSEGGSERCHRSKNLIQWLLDGTEQLRSLVLRHFLSSSSECSPNDVEIKNLKLPPTITELVLFTYESVGQRTWNHLLLHNELPNLTSLHLRGPAEGQESLFYQILDRYRHQLKTLEILDFRQIEIRVPVMANLEEFICIGSHWLCKDRLEICFPFLKKITLQDLDHDGLWNWLEGGVCPSVDTLSLDLQCGPTLLERNGTCLDQMGRLNHAFPHVTQLDLGIPSAKELSCIKYIFENMTRVQQLKIRMGRGDVMMFGFYYNIKITSEIFNAVLLDLPPEEVGFLEEERENWNNIIWDLNPQQSLVNMRELKTLGLYMPPSSSSPATPELNLDIVIKFALSKMPSVQELWLPKGSNNAFGVSPEVAQSWRDQGRVLRR